MKKDKFWKYFFAICATVVIGGGAATYGIIKFVSPQNLPAIALPNGSELFAHAQTPLTATTTEFFFQESVPLGYDKWSWGANVDWRTSTHYFEGSHGLSVTFTEEWGGIEIAGPGTITSGYNGISFAVYTEPEVKDLYVELYRKDGSLIGRQLLGWYAPGHKLESGHWQEIAIPLQNFDGNTPSLIGRISIIGKVPGRAYFDSIRLVRTATPQPRWEASSEDRDNSSPALSDLLKQTAVAPLPFALEFTPLAAGLWYPMTGSFRFAATEALLGLTQTGTDSTALFLAGREWTDYRVESVVDWGTPSTYSLLVRFADEQNFASCAFSSYGMYAQLYSIHNGESTLIGETPELAIPQLDTWKEVKHGAEVQGNRVTCLLNGEKILSAEIPTLPKQGTVGMEAWSREPGGIPHRILSFTVNSL